MIIIPPETIDDTVLISSDVPETDQPDWLTATGYIVGDIIQETTPDIHQVYECTVANTSDSTNRPSVDVDPDTGIGSFWIRLSATNTWAMFSDQLSDQTEQATAITVTLNSPELIDSIAFFELSGESLDVEVDDAIDGIVYTNTVQLGDINEVNDWYEYFYNPIIGRSDVVLTDLPAYSGADINITINATGTAKCGLVVIGYKITIGIANHGTIVGIINYTTKNLDSFGRPIVVPGNYSKRANYDVTLRTDRVSYVQRTLANLRNAPLVWIGEEDLEATIVYGFYRDFDILYQDTQNSATSIEVEGLT